MINGFSYEIKLMGFINPIFVIWAACLKRQQNQNRCLMKNFSFVTILSLVILLAACTSTHQTEQQQENYQSQAAEISIEGAAAHWVSSDRLIWDAGDNAEQVNLYYSRDAEIQITRPEVTGGESIALSPDADLSDELADKFRHISHRPVFSLSADPDQVREALKGQLVAVAKDEDGLPLRATQVQIHGVIDDLFIYDGDLGPVYNDDSISLALWAPTAQSVTLRIYDEGKNLAEQIDPADESPADGVWHFEGPSNWDRMFYRFDVRVYHHETGQIHNFKVTDPYSVSLATDSEYSQFVDVTNDDLKPEGWDDLIKTLPEHTDITLYEAHMRDFSIIDQTVPEEHRGTYMAFTHNGQNGRNLSDGMAHLKRLSDAGLTHLHLLPINDIASIYESRDLRVDLDDPYSRICEIVDVEGLRENCDRYGDTPIWEVFEQMAEDDPITKEIQRTYAERGEINNFSRHDGFNWGYDPYHFNVPQGSYSTDPDGTRRILETRKMVKSLYEIGLNIVVDVVYNHTHATGDSRYSVLDKVVPGYYQRLNPDTGEVERSTCCPNTAAEFAMMERLILDSVIFWAKHYKIDSFRFDLMGHHPKYVMENLLDALAELTPEEHGVDGSKIYIYGEGWNFGEVADNRIFDQATQFMMGGTGIGNFNDRIRDAIRGGFFAGSGRDQGFANGRYLFPNEEAGDPDDEKQTLFSHADRIRVGMTGNLSTYPYINRHDERVDGGNEMIGYSLNPQESVNYIDKHDNETLWDNTQAKLPFDLGMDERVRIHMLSNAFINYGQGIPFYQLGSDMLRSKSMDRNSYVSGDWFNAVDYTMETHNWAIGLPPEWDNADQWDDHKEFMANPNINVEKEHIEQAHQQFLEQLQIRYSSPLFRLQEAGQIHTRVGYHNTGADQVPGIIAMTISDGRCAGESLDESLDGILVIFNADMEQHEIDLGISGMELHHIQQNGVDDVIRPAAEADGVFTVPALSAAVFVKPASGGQGDFPCNPALD
jgi:pullulanase